MNTSEDTQPYGSNVRFSLTEALRSARETRAIVIGEGVLNQIPKMFRELFPSRRAVIVADSNTYPIAGCTVMGSLAADGVTCLSPFLYHEKKLYAEYGHVEALTDSLSQHDAIPVAVGSGTINDLTKLAAHCADRKYMCVATAASMDGYTAFGASITFHGAKQTFSCPAPIGVLADLDVLCRAPAEMTAAGYADLLAKITAGADWILADTLGVEPLDMRAWTIVQGGLHSALADPIGVRKGYSAAIAPLIEGLMLGGLAMQWTQSSRPASGAEHQFSHLWDMEHHTYQGEVPSHGFKVGVATLIITAFYEYLLQQPFEKLNVADCVTVWPTVSEAEAGVRRLFAGEEFLDTVITETIAKHPSPAVLERQLSALRAEWSVLRARLNSQLLPCAEMKRLLRAVGAPTEPEEIGLTCEHVRSSFRRAQHIRRRFTVLDLALRTGTWDRCLDALFGKVDA
jgi:glycerol-1-phosphate dehydrogenase [NAD(P)+]